MSKKIILIGASGTIGNATLQTLKSNGYKVVTASFSGTTTDYSVDIQEPKSIEALYEKVGDFDGVVSTTGKVAFKEIDQIEQSDWDLSLSNKLLGQINLIQIGSKYISKGGSFTLTSGILNIEPIAKGSIAATVNAGLEAFVKSASLEYKNFRVNVVSPTVVTQALEKYGPFFIGFESIDVSIVADAYLKSIAGISNGQVIKVGF